MSLGPGLVIVAGVAALVCLISLAPSGVARTTTGFMLGLATFVVADHVGRRGR